MLLLDFRNRQDSNRANAAQRSDVSVSNVSFVVVDQQRSNKLYMLIVMLLLSVALRCAACVCVCVLVLASTITSEMFTLAHTYTGATGRKAFALKVFLDEFRAPFFFFNSCTHTNVQQPPLSLTHTQAHYAAPATGRHKNK